MTRGQHILCCVTILFIATLPATALAAATAKLVIKEARLFTMAPKQRESFRGYLAVAQDGTILAVGEGDPPPEVIDAQSAEFAHLCANSLLHNQTCGRGY